MFSFLFPGAGQIYNGQVGKGVALLLFAFLSVPLWLVGIGLLITPILVVVAVYDAYTTAKKINRGQVRV